MRTKSSVRSMVRSDHRLSSSSLPAHCASTGDFVYVPVMGQSIVILGSPRVLSDLLEKRSAVTSDKPHSALIPLYVQPMTTI